MITGKRNGEESLGNGVRPDHGLGSVGVKGLPRPGRGVQFALLVVGIAALAFVAGCIAYVHTSFPPIVIDTEGHRGHHGYYARPQPQYYCYDCHGYTYFDPYYDFCTYYGFRFRWDSHPSVRRYYREHYTVIMRDTPRFGEYKYKSDYRGSPKYERPPDFETWKKSEGRTFYKGKESPDGKSSGKKSPSGKSSTEKSSGKKSSEEKSYREK